MPEAVDLGLSVKWSSCYLGASTPFEYGLYFTWGGTKGYIYDEEHAFGEDTNPFYIGRNGKDGNAIYSKYCLDSDYGTIDNLSTLESQDDAAFVTLGEGWRMPTWSELSDLIHLCTVEEDNSIHAYKVTSKVSGFEGNCIYIYLIAENTKLRYGHSTAEFWTSSLYGDYMGWYLAHCFAPTYQQEYMYLRNRSYGLNIRPVYTK